MAMTTGTKLKPMHQPSILLDRAVARSYRLWLSCGHSGGVEAGGVEVCRKKCRECHGFRAVVRAEPFDAR